MTLRILSSLTGALAVVSMTVASAGQAKPGAAPSPASLTNGAALYKRQCVMCHGAAGLGDGPAAKSLKGKLPNLADKAVMSKITDDQMHTAITAGKKTEIGNMPALGKRLTVEEITDIVRHVRTLAK